MTRSKFEVDGSDTRKVKQLNEVGGEYLTCRNACIELRSLCLFLYRSSPLDPGVSRTVLNNTPAILVLENEFQVVLDLPHPQGFILS